MRALGCRGGGGGVQHFVTQRCAALQGFRADRCRMTVSFRADSHPQCSVLFCSLCSHLIVALLLSTETFDRLCKNKFPLKMHELYMCSNFG